MLAEREVQENWGAGNRRIKVFLPFQSFGVWYKPCPSHSQQSLTDVL